MRNTSPKLTSKKVGVIIPIYNVEQYLRECLDSVINQTYKNLEVILVNDGSTRKENLKIAKEYVLKDSRFILFDKENGGLSSARNVGIEYFSGNIKLQKTSNELRGGEDNTNLKAKDCLGISLDSLQTYVVIDSNPYHIKQVYTQANNTINSQDFQTNRESSKTTQSQPIDYIIFLDSDDYWEKECVEECVKAFAKYEEQGKSVEAVCFDFDSFNEDGSPCFLPTWDEGYGFTQPMLITPQEWMDRTKESFALAWRALIDFKYLNTIKLRFLNGVINEDTNFGTMLFAQATNIFFLGRKLYHYRIRTTSISNPNSYISPYLEIYLPYFNNNTAKLRLYNRASSWILLALDLLGFLQNFNNKEIANGIKEKCLPYYVKQGLNIYRASADPLNLRPKLPLLLPYLENTPLSFYERILAFHPLLRPIAVKIHHFYLWQKDLERRFRRWWKSILKYKKD